MATAANTALILARGGFDVVHVHEPGLPATPFGTTLRSSALRVATFHATSELALASPFRSIGRSTARRRLDAALVPSAQALAIARARFGDGEYRLLPDGVDTDALRPAPVRVPARVVVEWTPGGRPAARAVVRALEEHDVDVVLLAAAGRRGVLAAAGMLPGRVRVERAATPSSRADLLAGAAAFVAAPGGSAHAALEAAAFGVPIAAADDAPAAELVEHERTGLRFPEGHPELAAAVTLRLLGDEPLRARLGAAARQLAESRSYDRIADQLEQLYAELADRRRPEEAAPAPTAPRDTILVDLHMHTRFSPDCATEVDDLLDSALDRGLGAIAVTDHNTIAGGVETARRVAERGLPLTVIVGSELMTEGDGEVIGLFLDEEIPRGLSLAETLDRIHDQGGLVYVPHPFDRMHSTPRPESLRRHVDELDVLETANARLYFESDNGEAARFAERYNLLVGAGSDAHVPQGVGTGALRMARFEGPAEFLLALRGATIERRSRSLLYLQGLKWVRQLSKPGAEPPER